MPNSWDDFFPEVLPDVPGCPIQLARNAIRNAAIDFCNETRVWREQIQDVTLVVDTPQYNLDTTGSESAADVVALHRVVLASRTAPLPTIAKQHLDDQILQTKTSEPRYYNCDSPPVVRFYPTPDGDYSANCFAILKPTRASTEGPSFLYTDWLEHIAHGAKARLMAMADRPWSNPSMVSFHRSEFIKGKTEARIRDVKSNVQSSSQSVAKARFGFFGNRGRYR